MFSDSVETSKEEFRNTQKRINKLMKQKSENTYIGIAPHSVTSVHKRLFKILVKYCKKNNILLTIRLAESKDEIDWLKHGFSDSDVLGAFCGNKKFDPAIQGVTPVIYLKSMDVLNKQMIATYGNYLTDEDLEILKENKVSFCYCPRVSKKLHNKVLDFEKVNETFKKRYGFGTNSLAFNDDLSLLNEVKSVNNGVLNADEVIAHLTIYPAKILRLDNITGSLESGKDADFNVFFLNDNEDYNAVINKSRPDYVYIKGKGELLFEDDPDSVINLSCLKQGIGLAGEDVGKVRIRKNSGIKKILTIENLTTFFRWQEKDSLMIYLGGYHNSVRRKLLELLYQDFPKAEYLHFGDIDVGGFEIYRDLCRKTGIPFKTYHMGIEELEKYEAYTQELTGNDRKRLAALIQKAESEGKDIRVLLYMKEKGRKLEQEGIRQI